MPISMRHALPVLLAGSAFAQATPVSLPPGTPLTVRIPDHLPLRVGTPIVAELLYGVYAENKLVLPANTLIRGSVTALAPDHPARVRARFGGDFTPLRKPVVSFTSLVLADGTVLAIATTSAAEGAPLYRLVAPPPRHGGRISQAFQDGKQFVRDRVAVLTGPDKGDRALQFLYRQLPYHPQRISTGTAWTVETSAPLSIPTTHPALPVVQQAQDTGPQVLQAYLAAPISSASSHAGDVIHATVAEPALNPDGTVSIPQGAILTGVISRATPARKLSRAGVLQFSFRQLTLPGGAPQPIRASLKGADSAASGDLTMDSEGQVKPKEQDKVVVPLILLALAARPLDSDGGRHMFRHDALASNSLGLLGFIVGTAARRPNIAAGIGYYGAAVSLYQRIFARGKEVAFPQDTRIVVETAATRSAPVPLNPR